MLENVRDFRSCHPVDIENPLVKSMLDYMSKRGREAKRERRKGETTMTRQEYIDSILTKKQIKDIEHAIDSKRPILITGEQGPTGKTTLAKYLREYGAEVYESRQVLAITLDKRLEKIVWNVLDAIEDRRKE